MNAKNLTALLAGAAIAALAMSPVFAAAAAAGRRLQSTAERLWPTGSRRDLDQRHVDGARAAERVRHAPGHDPRRGQEDRGRRRKIVAADAAPRDPKFKTTDLPHECGQGFSGAGCGYNFAWIDPGNNVMRVNGEPRTSSLPIPPMDACRRTSRAWWFRNPYCTTAKTPRIKRWRSAV